MTELSKEIVKNLQNGNPNLVIAGTRAMSRSDLNPGLKAGLSRLLATAAVVVVAESVSDVWRGICK